MLLPKPTQLKSSSITMALFLTTSPPLPCFQQHKQLVSTKLWSPLSTKRIQCGRCFEVKSFCSKDSGDPIPKTVDSSVDGAEAVTRVGVEKKVLKAGKGPKPTRGQSITVHCTGFGKNGDLGEKFWSTKDPGQQPFTFKIGQGQVIKGWDEGVLDMQVGEVARLRCSPDYAYGPNGFPAWGIQPDSVLIFEIEVLNVRDIDLLGSFKKFISKFGPV